ncbi:MAG TPA: hypothetical protein VJP40_08775, partial [bacterium]|nr:hypothetical protein [bacterium]
EGSRFFAKSERFFGQAKQFPGDRHVIPLLPGQFGEQGPGFGIVAVRGQAPIRFGCLFFHCERQLELFQQLCNFVPANRRSHR